MPSRIFLNSARTFISGCRYLVETTRKNDGNVTNARNFINFINVSNFNANEPAVEVRTEGLDVDGLEVDGLPRVSASHAEQPNQIQDSLE